MRYLKAQKNLHHNTLYNPRALCFLLILLSLKIGLRFLDVDVLLYPMVGYARYLKAWKNLHHNTPYNPRALCFLLILLSLKIGLRFLDVDVLFYPVVDHARYLKAQKNLHHCFLLILPSLKTSLRFLNVDVLLYLMVGHRHRIELPQVMLCPRHTGVGSERLGRLCTAREMNLAVDAMRNGLICS